MANKKDPKAVAGEITSAYVGYDFNEGAWRWDRATYNYGAIVAGIAVSMIMSKTGANRYLPKGINF
jgi:hypothetical protein